MLVGVEGGDGEVDEAGGTRGGEEGHFGFELEVVAAGEPRAEPGAADEAEAALAVGDAAVAQESGHGAIGPAAQKRHAMGVGEAVADDEVGVVAQFPKAVEIGGAMLAVAVEEEEPFDSGGEPGQGVAEGGGLAVVRAGEGDDLGAGGGGEAGGGVATGVVEDEDGEAGAAACAHDAGNGGGFVAGGNEDEGAVLRGGLGEVGGWGRHGVTSLR